MPRKLLRNAVVAALWLAIWAGAAAAVGQSLLLPTPLETGRAFIALAGQPTFWASVLASVLRVSLGFLIGMVTGTALAVLTSRSRWARDFFSPMLSAVKATPVASFIVLALVWIRTDGVPVFATLLVVLPVVWTNVATGIASTSTELLEMARAFTMGPTQKVRHIYWPSVRPYFDAAVTTGMGMAWKAGVAAEVISRPRMSLGGRLYDAKIYLDTPSLFASTAAVILLSILLERIIARIIRGRRVRRNGDG